MSVTFREFFVSDVSRPIQVHFVFGGPPMRTVHVTSQDQSDCFIDCGPPLGLVLVTAIVCNFFSLSFYMMVPIESIQSKMVSHVMYLCIGLKNPCQVYLCDILTVLYMMIGSWRLELG